MTMEIRTQGYSSKDSLTVYPEGGQCGSIKDGIAFEHDRQGPWVISFEDLGRIYRAAVKARKLSNR